MPNELSILTDHPLMLTIGAGAFLVGYVMKIAAQTSETVASLLGRLGKRWQEQDRRAVRKAAAARTERNAQIEDMQGQIEYFGNRVERMGRQLTDLLEKSDLKDDYLNYDAEWHATMERHAAQSGWVFPPPKHQTFAEFAAARETPAT